MTFKNNKTQTKDHYFILKNDTDLIGKGNFGYVYRATNLNNFKKYVVKEFITQESKEEKEKILSRIKQI